MTLAMFLAEAAAQAAPVKGAAAVANNFQVALLAFKSGGWIVALADMPAVKPATIARIVDALHAGASLAAPFLHGERGHPVGFAAHHRDALLQLAGDVGARSLMQAQRNALVVLDVDDPGVLYDVDRRDDLARPV